MSRNCARLFSALLVICLLLAVLPVSAMAAGCKWYGRTSGSTLKATAATYKFTVNCDSSYDVDIEFAENPQRSTYSGYVNKWVTVKQRTKKYLYLKVEENFSNKVRECTVTLTCNKHGYQRIYTIKQKASTTAAPTVSVSLSKYTAKPGDTVKLTVRTKNARRLFANFVNSGLRSTNWSRTTKPGDCSYSLQFDVPQNMASGSYRIPVEVSNSSKLNDAWARSMKKSVTLKIQTPQTGRINLMSYMVTDLRTAGRRLGLEWVDEGEGGYVGEGIEMGSMSAFGDSLVDYIYLTSDTSGKYCMDGSYLGMNAADAENLLLNNGWDTIDGWGDWGVYSKVINGITVELDLEPYNSRVIALRCSRAQEE